MKSFRIHVLALALLAPAAATLVAEPAAAQQRARAPQIQALTVNSDEGLAPGSRLQFDVRATPNARLASVSLGNTNITVPLKQVSRGHYRGSYTVRRGDRIDPMALMQARVTVGLQTVARSFYYPTSFQALAMGAAPAAASGPAPDIERFVMRPMGRIEPGRELRFRLRGDPGGEAWVDIPGVVRGLQLAEVRPGVYEGHYTVRRRDNLEAFDDARATLQDGNQRTVARLDLRGDDRDVMGAAGPLPLRITSPADQAVVDARGNLWVEGRTAPHATVRVQVDAVANVAGMLGLNQPVADQTVEADRNGRFAVAITPRTLPIPGTRYEVRLTATQGNETASERIVLHQRG